LKRYRKPRFPYGVEKKRENYDMAHSIYVKREAGIPGEGVRRFEGKKGRHLC